MISLVDGRARYASFNITNLARLVFINNNISVNYPLQVDIKVSDDIIDIVEEATNDKIMLVTL